jgi:hypothetical protein
MLINSLLLRNLLGPPWRAPLLGPLLVHSRGNSGNREGDSMKGDSLGNSADVSVAGKTRTAE